MTDPVELAHRFNYAVALLNSATNYASSSQDIALSDHTRELMQRHPVLSSSEKLRLYAAFKQAHNSSHQMPPRPAFWDTLARAKWDAWNAVRHWSVQEAQYSYVELIISLLKSKDVLRVIVKTSKEEALVERIIQRLSGHLDLTTETAEDDMWIGTDDESRNVVNSHDSISIQAQDSMDYSESPEPAPVAGRWTSSPGRLNVHESMQRSQHREIMDDAQPPIVLSNAQNNIFNEEHHLLLSRLQAAHAQLAYRLNRVESRLAAVDERVQSLAAGQVQSLPKMVDQLFDWILCVE